MRLSELVNIDNRFEKSINLSLDLDDKAKLQYYIPTRSSVKILAEYLKETETYSGNRATIMIGPYGKGKSHLLLVLMALLSQKNDETERLINRILEIAPEHKEILEAVSKNDKPMLPVIINNRGENLEHSFLKALSLALKRYGLSDITPNSYYKEAVSVITKWKEEYPDTYKRFEKLLGKKKVSEVIFELGRYNESTMNLFKSHYVTLTSGSEFQPLLDDDIVSVYRSVAKILCAEKGYRGIYIIFDEFSKYIEGHSVEGFASDMLVLQSMCEACNNSKDEQIHLTCVAHKSVKSYGNALKSEIINSFKGVEGRLKEVFFVTSSQNNYELIADAISKTEAFDKWAKENTELVEMNKNSYLLPVFSSLFDELDFDNIVGKGCYPLTPVTAFLLLGLSEKVAQNERTLFTYLTGKSDHSLAVMVDKGLEAGYVGTDSIYDYFLPLFKEDNQTNIRHEWLKADYALGQVNANDEKAVIKCLAVIKMINRGDEVPATAKYLTMACPFSEVRVKKALEKLVTSNLIEFKERLGVYDFKNNVGVDVEEAISDCVKKYYGKISVAAELDEIIKQPYIIPKKHNQTYNITRYFNIKFLEAEQFSALPSADYLKWKNKPDGTVVLILNSTDDKKKEVLEHLAELNDPCMILLFQKENSFSDDVVKKLLAVRRLKVDKTFIETNVVLKTELDNLEKSIIEDLNRWCTENYFNENATVYVGAERFVLGRKGLNRFVSDICDKEYYLTPIINNELINRHNVSSQVTKARNIILKDILKDADFDQYLEGTSAEATLYRAILLHTKDEPNVQNIRNVIKNFILSSVGEKNTFDTLINTLTSRPIGMREGVIPVFLLQEIVSLQDIPVVYYGSKEVAIDIESISNIVKRPSEYSLYIEADTAQKELYIKNLEELFDDYTHYCIGIDKRNRLARLACKMQSWYRSLPQASTVFKVADSPEHSMRNINSVRRIFADLYMNPRDIIFDKLPKTFKASNYLETFEALKEIKGQLDAHIHILKNDIADIIRTEFAIEKERDLQQSLLAWYNELPDSTKNTMMSTGALSLLKTIKLLSVNNEEEIASKIGKDVVGSFVEDWKDEIKSEFKDSLHVLVEEIREKKETKESDKHISLVTKEGTQKELIYSFDMDNLSTSGFFFQNALTEMMEEYEDTIDNNEKIGILMHMISELMEK